MKNLAFLLLGVISIASYAQTFDFNNYQPLKSKGTLPVEFTTSSTEKYEAKKGEIAKSPTKFERDAQNKYYLESTFGLDGMLKNGKVLYNDTIGNYLTAILQKLLSNNTSEGDVRVYCIKSPEINAYATGAGVVFVTMGLVASVKSEAQLAFILCHEYMHYVYKHSVKGYIQSKKILKGKGNFGDMSMDKRFLETRAFDREQESEADLKGLEIYLESEYSLQEIDSAFEILKYSYLPFGSEKFDKNFTNVGFFKVPDAYFLTKLSAINMEDFENAVSGQTPKKKRKKPVKDSTDTEDEGIADLTSTHPSIAKRLKDLHNGFGSDKKERKQFVISRDAFFFVRKVARFELVRINLLNHSYERALYNAYNLLKEDPDSRYLKKSVLKALYGIAKFGNTGNLSLIHIKKKYTQGEWQQVPHLVSKLKGEGVSAWAITYVWKLIREYPDDPELKLIFTDLMNSMVEAHVKKKSDLIQRYQDTLSVGSKNKTLKPYIRVAFVDLFVNEEEFRNAYDYAFKWYSNKRELQQKGKKRATNYAELAARKKNDDDRIEENTREDISIRWNEKLTKGNKTYLDSGRVIILCPRYSYWVVKGAGGSYQYLESEKGRMEMENSLKDFLPAVFPEADLITTPNADEADKLNDIALLYDYAMEKVENGKLNMVATDYERVQELAQKYGAGNVILMNALCVREKKTAGHVIMNLLLTSMFIPCLPVVLYHTIAPSYSTSLYYITFNFNQDKIISANSRHVKAKANRSFFDSQLYTLSLKLKKS